MSKKGPELKIIYKNIEDLHPYAGNPRKNEAAVDKVVASIKEFGWQQPIVVDKDGVVVAGHTRLKAARALGMKTVPCVVADGLTPEQVKAYRLADNKSAEFSEWDFSLLAEELEGISELDMEAFGFIEVEDANDVIEDDYDEDARAIEERTRLGDMFELGEHILVCGDSTKVDDVRKAMGGAKPVFVFTDPPYGVSIGTKNAILNQHNKSKAIEENIIGDTLEANELHDVLVRAFSNLREVADEACSYYVSAPQNGSLGLMMMMMMMKDAGLEVRHNLVWVKNAATFNMGRLDYSYRHESIFYTWTKSHTFYGGYDTTVIDDTTGIDKMSKSELREALLAYQAKAPDSVIYCDKPVKNDVHPTMKPIKLIARFMVNSSQKGDVVADIFGGSGSTLITAEQLGRRCRMLELDPHYCDVIIDRWEQFTGRKANKLT